MDAELIRGPLATEARREQQAENLDASMAWLVDFADNPPPHLIPLDDDLVPGEYCTNTLYGSYLQSLHGTAAARYPMSKVGFGRWLSSLTRRGLPLTNGQVGGRAARRRTKRFPPLPGLRAWLHQQCATPDWDVAEQWDGHAAESAEAMA